MVVPQEENEGLRDDVECSSTKTSSSSYHLQTSHNHPLQRHQQLQKLPLPRTFDEWEAAIVQSISERPDEIIDILERYAEEREEYHEQESLSLRRQHMQAEEWRDDDNHTLDHVSEERNDVESRDGWSIARESFVAAFIDELRLKIAQLTYPTISAYSITSNKEIAGDTKDSVHPTYQQSDHVACNKLQAQLHAEKLKYESLVLRLNENRQMYEEQIEELCERILYLERRPSPVLDDPTKQKAMETLEEASYIESTEEIIGEKSIDETWMKQMEEKVSDLTQEIDALQRENDELKDTMNARGDTEAARPQIQDLKATHTPDINELIKTLEGARNEHRDLQHRLEESHTLVLQLERILDLQKKKMEKMALSLKRTTEIYEHERAARLSLERINDLTQAVLNKLHRKIEDRRDDIYELTDLLAQKDSTIKAMAIDFKDKSAKTKKQFICFDRTK
jgi:hypothetical protein